MIMRSHYFGGKSHQHSYTKLLFVLLFSAIFFFLLFSGVHIFAKAKAAETNEYGFAGGNGSTNSPFLIATAEQLNNMRNYSLNYDGDYDVMLGGNYFKVIADIDLTEFLSEGGAGYNGGKGWEPITIGAGTFDGGGFTISGFWCNRPDKSDGKYVGLFGNAVDAVIKNTILVLSEKGITGFSHCGGIAGLLTSYIDNKTAAVISGCSVTGNITSVKTEEKMGYDTSARAGLIAGDVLYATIEKCYAQGAVTGLTGIGGIAGDAKYTDISDCYFKGELKPAAPAEWETVCAGGIAGKYYGDSALKNCFYFGQTDNDARAAAIAGFNGDISAFDGGATALNPPEIYNCFYNSDVVKSPVTFMQPKEAWSEDCGDETCDHTDCDGRDYLKYAVINNSRGLTAAEMKDPDSYANWDFENIWGFDKEKNLVLRAFGTVYDPPNLLWLWLTLACVLFGAAAIAGGVILYRRKKTELITVTNTVEVEKEIVREVPIVKRPLPADLSGRERSVAELILKGKTRREIMDELNISEGAVRTYTARIYVKAGVNGQKEFIAYHLGGTQ